jgi:predicted transcriptional regulator
MPVTEGQRIKTQIRFAPGLYRQLARLSGKRERSINWLVNMAVAEYLRHEDTRPKEATP